jgi:hypothetical protein
VNIELRKIRAEATCDVYSPFWTKDGEQWSFDHVHMDRIKGKSYWVYEPCAVALGMPDQMPRFVEIPSEEPGYVAAVMEFDVARPHSFPEVVEVSDE